MIKVIFFAALREKLGTSGLSLSAEGINNVNDIKTAIVKQQPNWQAFFAEQSLLSAVNQDMVSGDYNVKPGDEVAFFPPVTGG